MSIPDRPDRDASRDEWAVFGDALEQRGDPRGVLIALNLAVAAGADPGPRDAHLATHGGELLGAAAAHLARLGLVWVGDRVDRVVLRVDPRCDATALVRAVLASPFADDVRTFEVIADARKDPEAARSRYDRNWGEQFETISLADMLAELFARWPANARELIAVDHRAREVTMLSTPVDGDHPAPNLVSFGSLDALWRCAGLQRVHLVVADGYQLDPGELDAPALEELVVHSLRLGDRACPDLLARLAAARLPCLRALELRLAETHETEEVLSDNGAYVTFHGYTDGGGGSPTQVPWDQWLSPVFAMLEHTPLERLALTSFASSDALFAALAAAKLPGTLRELDLSEGDVRDPAWFIAHASLLRGLATLRLERTPITAIEELRRALPVDVLHTDGYGAPYHHSIGGWMEK